MRLDRQDRDIPDGELRIGARRWTGSNLSDSGAGPGIADHSERDVAGWWLVPSAVLGLVIWVFIIRALLGFLA